MNRIKLLSLLSGLLLPFCVKAQDASGPAVTSIRLDAGIKIGANMARLNSESWEDGYKTNLLGGVFAGLHGNRLGLQVEGIFTQSEYKTGKDFNTLFNAYLSDSKDSLKSGRFRVNYLNIPILLQYRLLNRVWLQVGPQFSGVVSVKDRDAMVKDASKLFKDGYGKVSGVVGLNMKLPFHFVLGARYVVAFTDENNTNISDAWKQRNVQIHVGYSL
jgi:hypothetical protein